MTWFAEEIIAPARPELVEEFASFLGYRDSLYVIREISEQRWWPAEVRHGVPAEGLVVVRPVGEPGHHDDWYGEAVVPWLPPPGRGAIAPEVAPAEVALTDSSPDLLPPVDFLAYLKHVSKVSERPVAYGFFSTWGGSNELEYAWIFSEREFLLVNETTDPRCARLDPGGTVTEIDRPLLDVLAEALGFSLKNGYFAPHTRAFDWDRHRLRRR